ncbi:MAG: hypothetical protein ACK5LL_01170 [Suipraeoptans sp.]
MKIKNLLIVTLLSIAFVGCNDLDTLPDRSAYVTSTQKEDVYKLDPTKPEAGVNAIFAQFNQYMPNYEALGRASRHNDFGYPSIMMFTDANGFDVVSENNGYNWSGNDLDYDYRPYTSREAQIVWNYL